MHKHGWIATVILMLAMGAGCSREAPTENTSEQRPASHVPEENVFSDQVQALEKAEAVQKTLDDAFARQRESVERQEMP